MRAIHKTTGDELEVITTYDEHRKMGLILEKMYGHFPDDVTIAWIDHTWELAEKRIVETGLYEAVILEEGKVRGTMDVNLDEVEKVEI